LAESLPMELVLSILDAALINGRVDDLRWCLSLSLVCRTVRAAVLPIVYEVISLDIRTQDRGSFTSWDCHPHTDPKLAFLSWLLHDTTAPPRQYVKHIIFRHDGHFSYKDLGWVGMGVDSESSEWPFERLTARYHQDIKRLYRAGLRPQKVFHIGPSSEHSGILPSTDMFACAIKEAVLPRRLWRHQLAWPGKPHEDKISETASTKRAQQTCVLRGEMDPDSNGFIYNPSGQQAYPVYTVQLTSGDYLHQYPKLLLDGLMAAFKYSSDAQVILACNIDYRIADQTIGDFIRSAVPATLPREALEGRLRISHAGWTPIVAQDDAFYNLAHTIRRGGDPWDMGRGV